MISERVFLFSLLSSVFSCGSLDLSSSETYSKRLLLCIRSFAMQWFHNKVQAGASISSASDKFHLQKILGSGSFGTVALCRKNESSQRVALKVVKKADKEAQFMRLLTSRGSASHPIVRWISSFRFNRHYCHEYEALDISLEDFLHKSSTLPLHHIRPIISQMADALKFLKSVKMIHGDLKPANIMMVDHVRKPLQVKIIDFGLACLADHATQGDYFGTRSYSCPEMAIGAPMHHALDMWSVGCIAVELFLGKLVFPVDNPHDLIEMIIQLLGLPPRHVLESGLCTHQYFNKPDGQNWVHKKSDCISKGIKSPIQKLDDMHMMNPHSCMDLNLFVDLTKRLLDLDPDSRIDPQELMDHPFLGVSPCTHVDPKPHLESQSSISPSQTSPQKRKREDGHQCPEKRFKGTVLVVSLESQSSISPSRTSPQKRKREFGHQCPEKRLKAMVSVVSSAKSSNRPGCFRTLDTSGKPYSGGVQQQTEARTHGKRRREEDHEASEVVSSIKKKSRGPSLQQGS